MRKFDKNDLCASFAYKGLKLRLFWDGCTVCCKCRLSYILSYKGKEMYKGDDYFLGASQVPDSVDAITGLLGFLTLRPGDTDPDFFKDHSPEMLELVEGSFFEGELRPLIWDLESGKRESVNRAKKFFERHTKL